MIRTTGASIGERHLLVAPKGSVAPGANAEAGGVQELRGRRQDGLTTRACRTRVKIQPVTSLIGRSCAALRNVAMGGVRRWDQEHTHNEHMAKQAGG